MQDCVSRDDISSLNHCRGSCKSKFASRWFFKCNASLTKVTSSYWATWIMADLDKLLGFVVLSVQVLFDDLPAWMLVSGPLVGTYANSILYTLEVIAVIRYNSITERNRDSLLLQAVVYFTLVVDTVSTISTYVSVYLVCNYYHYIVIFILILMSLFLVV